MGRFSCKNAFHSVYSWTLFNTRSFLSTNKRWWGVHAVSSFLSACAREWPRWWGCGCLLLLPSSPRSRLKALPLLSTPSASEQVNLLCLCNMYIINLHVCFSKNWTICIRSCTLAMVEKISHMIFSRLKIMGLFNKAVLTFPFL